MSTDRAQIAAMGGWTLDVPAALDGCRSLEDRYMDREPVSAPVTPDTYGARVSLPDPLPARPDAAQALLRVQRELIEIRDAVHREICRVTRAIEDVQR